LLALLFVDLPEPLERLLLDVDPAGAVEREDEVRPLLVARDERGHRDRDLPGDVLERLLPGEILVEPSAEGAEGLDGGLERAGRERADLLVLEELRQRRLLERVAERRRRRGFDEEQRRLGEDRLEAESRLRRRAEGEEREDEDQPSKIHVGADYMKSKSPSPPAFMSA